MLSLPPDFESRCGGPEGRILWQNSRGSPFGLLNGGVATVYVVDVDGVRLVIASHYRGSTRDEQLESSHRQIDPHRLAFGRARPRVGPGSPSDRQTSCRARLRKASGGRRFSLRLVNRGLLGSDDGRIAHQLVEPRRKRSRAEALEDRPRIAD